MSKNTFDELSTSKGALGVIVAIVVALILLGGGTYFYQQNKTAPATTTPAASLGGETAKLDTSDWKTYQSNQIHFPNSSKITPFSFKYPARYSVDTSQKNYGGLVVKNEKGEAVLQLWPGSYDPTTPVNNTLDKSIQEDILSRSPGVESADRLLFEKIVETPETIGYLSQWRVGGVDPVNGKPRSSVVQARADFEPKLVAPLTNTFQRDGQTFTTTLKVVYRLISLSAKETYNDNEFNILRAIASTFKFTK